MRQRILLLGCTILLGACESYPLNTQRTTVTGARLLEYGVYRRPATYFVAGPKTSEGRIAMFDDEAKLLKLTDKVPAKVNTTFGIRYELLGHPKGAAADVVFQVVHPPIGNPRTGKTATTETGIFHSSVGTPEYNDVQIDAPWNAVPGQWTLRVAYQSRVRLRVAMSAT